jgi:hypothetical protein
MDRLTSMSSFVLVDTGSFSGAARQLKLSQGAVTGHIQSLEQQLGIRLLNRTTRKISLTDEGAQLYQRCTRIHPCGRTPRRYRGKDANWWPAKLGLYDRKVGELPSRKAKFAGKPHISGTRGGHTINLHQFARDGVVLLGRLEDSHGQAARWMGRTRRRPVAPDRRRGRAPHHRSAQWHAGLNGRGVP